MESQHNPSSKSQKPCVKPVTLQAHYQSTLDHLITMAATNGWKAYAWGRAQKLDDDPTGLWRGIADDLKKVMNAKSGKD